MIQSVIFDVDGTLLDTERLYMLAWQKAGAAAGYEIPMEALLQTRAVRTDVAIEVYQRYCGQDFPYYPIRDARVRISEEIIHATAPEELRFPHTLATLEWLARRGISMAVASSTPLDKTRSHLEQAGIWHFFRAAICGDMVSRGKPHPEIFLTAAQALGTPVENCLVVGDTPADVMAAHAAGIPVVLIPDQVPANPQTTALSQAVLPSLAQLPEFVSDDAGYQANLELEIRN